MDVDRQDRGIGAGLSVCARAILTLGAVVTSLAAAVPAHAQAPDPLSAARYAAIDAVNTVFASRTADTAEARRVCDALDRSDRLLAIRRKECLMMLKASLDTHALFHECRTALACSRVARRLATELDELITDRRAANRIIDADVPAGPCHTEMRRSAAALRSVETLRDGLRLLARGLRTHDHVLTRRAKRRLAHGGGGDETPGQRRDRFRQVCAPTVMPVLPVPPATPQPASPPLPS